MKTCGEITIDQQRCDFNERHETVKRRLQALLDAGRIKRVTVQVIDMDRRTLYTYWRIL